MNDRIKSEFVLLFRNFINPILPIESEFLINHTLFDNNNQARR